MMPSEAPQQGDKVAGGDMPPAALSWPALVILTQRADFQRATRSRSKATPGFILQMRKRAEGEYLLNPRAIRVGFTCSKKVGNAVARNRAKRRLREIARLTLPRLGLPGHDYVLVGRKTATASLPFSQLQDDLAHALMSLQGRAQ